MANWNSFFLLFYSMKLYLLIKKFQKWRGWATQGSQPIEQKSPHWMLIAWLGCSTPTKVALSRTCPALHTRDDLSNHMDFYDDEIFCANSLTILEGKKKSLTMGGTTFWFFFWGEGIIIGLNKIRLPSPPTPPKKKSITHDPLTLDLYSSIPLLGLPGPHDKNFASARV